MEKKEMGSITLVSDPTGWPAASAIVTHPLEESRIGEAQPDPRGGLTEGRTPTGGLKYDTDKPRMDLLPAYSLEQIALVLGFGAKKYSKLDLKGIEEWARSTQLTVNIHIESAKGGAYVALVTRPGSRSTTKPTTEKLQNIKGNTGSETEHASINMEESVRGEDLKIHPTNSKNVTADSDFSTDWMISNGASYWKTRVESALFARQTVGNFIQTTVIPLEKSGEYYALGATTVSDFLMTLSNLLSKQFNISSNLSKFEITGAWNWSRGIAYSRLLGACLRHLFAWARGENIDKESGLNHLAHAGCCVLFLIWMSEHRKDLDDRGDK